MIVIGDLETFDFDRVAIDPFWNTGSEPESKMHRIHSYPAKFPAFITTKALAYAKLQGREVHTMADIFCGCGTSAFEAKRNNIDFWGCDINPVATLIARTKSAHYHPGQLKRTLRRIVSRFQSTEESCVYNSAVPRLKYWYRETQYNDLSRLKTAILQETGNRSKYRRFFLCAFSNVLKPTSKWLTKSIKPQVDPNKEPAHALTAFLTQCAFMATANGQNRAPRSSRLTIETQDFLSTKCSPPQVDLIVTSPPYVTSYEYADLHQLSALWLGYATDYRDLRAGAVGTRHPDDRSRHDALALSPSGRQTVSELKKTDRAKAAAVRSYFLDLQAVGLKTYRILRPKGIALFVIGNTSYKGVRVNNARHLVESLGHAGFRDIRITRRRIIKKTLTPYRDERGRFSAEDCGSLVYGNEFLVVALRSA